MKTNSDFSVTMEQPRLPLHQDATRQALDRAEIESSRTNQKAPSTAANDTFSTLKATSHSRVVVPTDFSPSSSYAILCAHALADRMNGELIILYISLPINHHDASLNEAEAQHRAEELHRRAETLLGAQLRETIGAEGKTPVQLTIREGFAYECIVDEAQNQGADYIVIARHGHSDDRALLLGPTAESVVRHARCPVVLVDNPVNNESNIAWPER